MRGRDHDAEVGVDVGDEECDGRGGDHSGVEHVDAGAGEPGRDCRGDELARDPRVACDHRNRAPPRRRASGRTAPLAEDHCGGLGEAECEVGGEIGVRESANAIGAEQTARHVCC